jgi:iron(III) transport system ATP-binding protein
VLDLTKVAQHGAASVSAPLLKLDAISLAHGATSVVRAVSFDLQAGQIACLMGPSGCGKTTLLRAIAGLHAPSGGTISLRGRQVSSTAHQTAPEQRNLGFVFQDLALFPHMTVAQNIALGLLGWPKAKAAAQVQALLQRLSLTELAGRYPHELSGGQAQRVAIARALAPEHDLILLDEPFSSLDAMLRVELSRELRRQLKAQGTAAILVSHDQEEGLVCADVIGVMQRGALVQWGSPFAVYCQPANAFVGQFVGESSFIDGTLTDDALHTHFGSLACTQTAANPSADATALTQVSVLVRPEDLIENADTGTAARILHSEFRGAYTVYRLEVGGHTLLMSAAHAQPLSDGSTLRIQYRPRHLRVFAGERALELRVQ